MNLQNNIIYTGDVRVESFYSFSQSDVARQMNIWFRTNTKCKFLSSSMYCNDKGFYGSITYALDNKEYELQEVAVKGFYSDDVY